MQYDENGYDSYYDDEMRRQLNGYQQPDQQQQQQNNSSSYPSSQNTGIAGKGTVDWGQMSQQPVQDQSQQSAPSVQYAPVNTGGKLYGTLDQGKLDAARGGGTDSAKYEFLAEAEKHGYGDVGGILSALQARNGNRWNGWSAAGDKIRYSGGQLDPVFDGLTEFDVAHGYDMGPDKWLGWGWQDTRPMDVIYPQGINGPVNLPSNPVGPATGAPAAPAVNPEDEKAKAAIRDLLMKMAMQGTTIDRNDPQFRQMVDPYVANQERFRRQSESEAAERLAAQGLGSSGAMENERRVTMERAGQNAGMFESQLVDQELEARRDEIKFALTNLRGMLTTDQQMSLQQQLAQLDAALKRESMAQQDRQFNVDSGIRIGQLEAQFAPWM